MRNISCRLTTAQIIARLKRVTRRVGWTYLRPGDRLCAIEKGQGLKKGQRVKRLAVLRIVDVRFEPLQKLLDHLAYGFAEVALEGFRCPEGVDWATHVRWFVSMFCETHDGVTLQTPLTRIRFEYEEPAPAGFEWARACHDERPAHSLVFRGRRGVANIWDNGDHFVWSTWDRDGVGGENAADQTLELAQREVYAALARQVKRDPGRWWPIEEVSRA